MSIPGRSAGADTIRKVVDYWRAVEYLNVCEIPAVNASSGVRDIRRDGDWPWRSEKYRNRKEFGPDGEVAVEWFHIVYLGIYPAKAILTDLYRAFDEPLDWDLVRRVPKGHTAFAALLVDSEGRPIDLDDEHQALLHEAATRPKPDGKQIRTKQLELAALTWALGRIHATRNDGRLALGSFEEAADKARDVLESNLFDIHEEGSETGRIPFELSRAGTIIGGLLEIFGMSDGPRGKLSAQWDKPLARTRTIERRTRKGKRRRPVQVDMINSFLADDLDRVGNALAEGSIGEALRRYVRAPISGIGDLPRLDVRADADEARKYLHPTRFPRGAWPAKGGLPLVYAQQMAVNATFRELGGDRAGLFSVNGPPGTGKTTMLRDLVAAIIVRRAAYIAELEDPDNAFEAKARGGVYPFKKQFLGFEMVVASANNGAVENVTRELPSTAGVDESWLEINRDPLVEIARDLLRPVEEGTTTELAEDDDLQEIAVRRASQDNGGEAWALLAAVLGNSANKQVFAERFWFGRKPTAKSPVSYKGLRNLGPELLTTTDAAKYFTETKHEFLASKRKFEEERRRRIADSNELAQATELYWQKFHLSNRISEIEFGIDISECFMKQGAEEATGTDSLADQIQKIVDLRDAAEAVLRTIDGALADLDAAEDEAIDADLDAMSAEKAVVTSETTIEGAKALYEIELRNPPPEEGLSGFFARRDWKARLNKSRAEVAVAIGDLAVKRGTLAQAKAFARKARESVEQAQKTIAVRRESSVSAENEFLSAFAELRHSCEELHSDLTQDLENGPVGDFLGRASDAIAQMRALAAELRERIAGEAHKYEEALHELEEAKVNLNKAETTWSGIDERLRESVFEAEWPDEGKQELSSPWMDEAFLRARVELFLAAIKLHRAFLLAAWDKMSTNLRLAMDVLAGTAPPDVDKHLRHVWTALFMVVPVVSTTFASFGRMFKGLGAESLGWLFVDEAGQATPQSVLGALWRSRRAVIVGDPSQLEPVVTVPRKALVMMEEKFGIPEGFMPGEVSVQRLADLANPIGADVSDPDAAGLSDSEQAGFSRSGGRDWVGCPLRVHRRCDNPMFAVANDIAYNGLMVHGRKSKPGFEIALGDSAWIDVRGSATDEHYIEAEGEALMRIFSDHWVALAGKSVFVISPFRSVMKNLEEKAKEFLGADGEGWIKKHMGTVHTFQGKEADIVFLVLGGDEKKSGAFKWASEKPNLLNVAITRAKDNTVDLSYTNGGGDIDGP